MKDYKAICGYCYCAAGIESASCKGVIFSCPKCGAGYISGGVINSRVYHKIFQKGEISSEERVGAVYQVDSVKGKKVLFLTCPNCAAICRTSLSEVDEEGYVAGREYNSCIECGRCSHHFWPYLEGWDGKKK